MTLMHLDTLSAELPADRTPACECGQITNSNISDQARIEQRKLKLSIGRDDIQNKAVEDRHIATSSICTYHLRDGAVSAEKLGHHGQHLELDSVKSYHIAEGVIATWHLAHGIEGKLLADESVPVSTLKREQLPTSMIPPAAHYRDGTVGSSAIGAGSVRTRHLAREVQKRLAGLEAKVSAMASSLRVLEGIVNQMPARSAQALEERLAVGLPLCEGSVVPSHHAPAPSVRGENTLYLTDLWTLLGEVHLEVSGWYLVRVSGVPEARVSAPYYPTCEGTMHLVRSYGDTVRVEARGLNVETTYSVEMVWVASS